MTLEKKDVASGFDNKVWYVAAKSLAMCSAFPVAEPYKMNKGDVAMIIGLSIKRNEERRPGEHKVTSAEYVLCAEPKKTTSCLCRGEACWDVLLGLENVTHEDG